MVKMARSVDAIEKMAEMSATKPAMRMTLSKPDSVRKVTDALRIIDAWSLSQSKEIQRAPKNAYHDARARANDEHGRRGSQPALLVRPVIARTVNEEVRNAETQAGYRKVQKDAGERAAVGWRFRGFSGDVRWQGFAGTEVLLAPLG